MSSPSPAVSLNIGFRSDHYSLSLLPSETYATLQARLEELTSVPPPFQKLLYKGKRAQINIEGTIEEAGLKDGTKVTLLGSTQREVGGVMAAEAEKRKRDDIMRQRQDRGPSKAIIPYY
jgi:Ubiquitin family